MNLPGATGRGKLHGSARHPPRHLFAGICTCSVEPVVSSVCSTTQLTTHHPPWLQCPRDRPQGTKRPLYHITLYPGAHSAYQTLCFFLFPFSVYFRVPNAQRGSIIACPARQSLPSLLPWRVSTPARLGTPPSQYKYQGPLDGSKDSPSVAPHILLLLIFPKMVYKLAKVSHNTVFSSRSASYQSCCLR